MLYINGKKTNFPNYPYEISADIIWFRYFGITKAFGKHMKSLLQRIAKTAFLGDLLPNLSRIDPMHIK